MSGQPIIRSDDLRAENRHRILRTLRRKGPQTRALTGDKLIDVVQHELLRSLSQHPGNTLRHISIGFQGVTEHASGNLMWSPILGIKNVPLRKVLQQRFKVAVVETV